eukprot:SAG22_NODE_1017_length_6016_cov_40.662667_10_plen_66_part_00
MLRAFKLRAHEAPGRAKAAFWVECTQARTIIYMAVIRTHSQAHFGAFVQRPANDGGDRPRRRPVD